MKNKLEYSLEDILKAAQYGFEYHRDSQNNDVNVPVGNVLQWLMGEKKLLELPEEFKKYKNG